MKHTLRSMVRTWKSGVVKSVRLYYITLPLILFFALVMTLAGLSSFGYGLSKHISQTFEDRINMVVYFTREADPAVVEQIVAKVKERQDVRKVDFHDAAKVLADFKEKHEKETVVMESLNEIGVNPFGASLVVYAKETAFYETLSNDVKSLGESYKTTNASPVEEVTYEEHKIAIDRISRMLERADRVASILIVILSAMLLFTLYIALRFVTQGDREEIKIMKLVGASNFLMIGPTAVLGGLAGFFGALLSLFVLYFSAQYLTRYTLTFDEFNLLAWYIELFPQYLLYTVAFGIVFGIVGSVLAVRRHI